MPFPSRAFRRPRSRAPGYLFALGTDDFAEAIPTGQALTFDRNSGRTAFDTEGRVVTLAQDQFPWSAAYNSAAGIYEPVYEPFEAITNRIFPSEDFGTSWAAVGTPTRVAAAKRCGDLVLDLIGDDAAGTLEGYTRACTPSGGNGPKGVSVFVAQGTSTSSVIRGRDMTAGANTFLGVLTWVSGAPSVSMTSGLYLGARRCFGGAWRLHFTSGTWTVGNTNQIEVYPATTSGLAVANTGTLYVGGVQVEDGHYPRGYVKTVGATVTTLADSCTCPLDWAPQNFTLYGRLAKPVWLGQATSSQFLPGIMASGPATGNWFQVNYDTLTRVLKADIGDGVATATALVSVSAVADVFEFTVEFDQVIDGAGARVRIDIGSGPGSWATSAAVLGSAWTGTTLRVGQLNASGLQADAGIRRLVVAAGGRTLSQLRGPQP